MKDKKYTLFPAISYVVRHPKQIGKGSAKVLVYPSELWPEYDQSGAYRIKINRRWYPYDVKVKWYTRDEIGHLLTSGLGSIDVSKLKYSKENKTDDIIKTKSIINVVRRYYQSLSKDKGPIWVQAQIDHFKTLTPEERQSILKAIIKNQGLNMSVDRHSLNNDNVIQEPKKKGFVSQDEFNKMTPDQQKKWIQQIQKKGTNRINKSSSDQNRDTIQSMDDLTHDLPDELK